MPTQTEAFTPDETGQTQFARVAADQLKSLVERIERLEEEKQTIADDIKDVYAEAKAHGYDAKILRQVVRIRKQDKAEREEMEALLELYMSALAWVTAGWSTEMAKTSVTKTVTVEADVDLDDFDDGALLDELVERGAITRRLADAISDGKTDLSASIEHVSDATRADILADLMLSRRTEALIALERALGRDFIGRLTG